MSDNEVYDKWIAVPKNRDDVNTRRRERYANDEEYRAKAQAQAKKSRASTVGNSKENPYQLIDYNGVEYRVYKVGYAIAYLKTSICIFNRICNLDIVPEIFMLGKHRMITKNQIRLIKYVIENEEKIPSKLIKDKLKEEWL